MYWSSFDLDHYKRKRHWSSLHSKRGILIPNPDCNATGREGENRDNDLCLVDRVRRLLLRCPQVPSLWSSQSWTNNEGHSEAMNIPRLPNTWTKIYIGYLQLGLFRQPSNRHKCKQQVPRRRDTKSKQVVSKCSTLAIHGRPLRIMLRNMSFLVNIFDQVCRLLWEDEE